MKKSSLVLGVILTHLLAPHSQATYSSGPTALKAFDDWVTTLDPQTREYFELMHVKIVPEDKGTGVPSPETDVETLGSCTAHAMAVRTDQNERGYCDKGPEIVRSSFRLNDGVWYVSSYGQMEASPAPAQAMTIESIGLSCSAHAITECITQSALPLTPTTPSYPMDHEIQQDLHPVARRALGSALFDAKPEEALRRCITHSVGERHRESAAHLVKLLDRQTLVDILNMMCVVARNRGGYLQDRDPFAEASVFISRAPMKSIAMKKPRDEDAQ